MTCVRYARNPCTLNVAKLCMNRTITNHPFTKNTDKSSCLERYMKQRSQGYCVPLLPQALILFVRL